MRRFGVLTLALGALALALAVAGCGGGGGTTMTVVEHATTDAVTDTGASGDSAGDILTFANEVYDEANAQSIGSDNGWCVRTVVGKAWECFWTNSLKDGQITVEGPFLDAGPSTLAITGGTGAYADAEGEMDISANNDDATEFKFVFNLK